MKKQSEIIIPSIRWEIITVPIWGDFLIMNRFSEASKGQIERKQQGEARMKKAPRVPKNEYEASMHKDQDGDFAFPSIGFKKAMVAACRYVDGMPMTVARGAFRIIGRYVKIKGSKPEMCSDLVKLDKGPYTIAYRAGFPDWNADLTVRYNADILTKDQVCNLINVAGQCVGVGAWRIENSGDSGTFEIKEGKANKRSSKRKAA